MINIYLRHAYFSPNSTIPNRKRPEWFDKTNIFRNFVNLLTDECKTTIVYDSHFGDNSEILSNIIDGRDIQIKKINRGTEAGSFLETMEIIKNDNLPDGEIVYFLEDDYIHRPGWAQALKEGVEISHYISLYDHLDKYLHYEGLRSELFLTESSHWRTTPSTCNTYACKMKWLREDWAIHQQYSINHNVGISNDNGKFLHLGGIGRRLITPVPGFSTHCDLLQSPLVDWRAQLNWKSL